LLTAELTFLFELISQWMSDLKLSYDGDPWILDLQQKMVAQPLPDPKFSTHQGLVRYKGRICVGATRNWRQQLLKEVHDSSAGGHSGATATYHHLKQLFYWPHLKEDVLSYVKSCSICQMTKPEHVHTPGLLQPLPIPVEAWSSIGIYFITGLPKSDRKEVIMVVVDRLMKFAHFIALSHPYSATTVAQFFIDHISCLHGLPSCIVSDRDPVFTNKFWKELI
jgi:Integrase zinc binding domain